MKKIVSLLLAIAMLFSVRAVVCAADVPQQDFPQRFWDVPKNHWAFSCIAELVNKGVLAGYEDGSFQPDRTVTRAEWAKIMVLAAGLTANDTQVYFTDMGNHWANIYVNTAKEYLAAYTDGTFKPDQAAVREDVTVSMVKLKGYDVGNVDYSYLSQFTDTSSISNRLKAYVAVAVQKGLISGFEDGTFRGQNTLTRAEAATLLWRAFRYGNDNKIVDMPDTPITTSPVTTITEEPTLTEEPKSTEKPKPEKENPAKNENSDSEETNKAYSEREEKTDKPYKIETLSKVIISSSLLYTKDKHDDIYYADGDKIKGINFESREISDFFDAEDLNIDNERCSLEDFTLKSIAYDNTKNRIIFTGNYKTVNPADCSDNKIIGWCDGDDFEVLSDNFDPDVVSILDNGDYVTSTGDIYDNLSLEYKDHCLSSYHLNGRETSFVNEVVQSNGKIYGVASLGYDADSAWGMIASGLSEYSFTGESKMILDFTRLYGSAITEDSVAANFGDCITCINFYGKELYTIRPEDIQIEDSLILKFSDVGAVYHKNASEDTKIFRKMMIASDNSIILYDGLNKALRIISKNK